VAKFSSERTAGVLGMIAGIWHRQLARMMDIDLDSIIAQLLLILSTKNCIQLLVVEEI